MGQACAVTNVTGLELAIIPAGAALVGVVLGTVGNAYLDRRRDRRAACRERDQAIAELLTATVDLISGVQAVRAAYPRSSNSEEKWGSLKVPAPAGCRRGELGRVQRRRRLRS
jgi:hypothetical protein